MSNYEKCITMYLITGKIPMVVMGAVCADAHRQIYEDANSDTPEVCDAERDDYDDFKRQWFKLEEDNDTNFCMH